MKTALAHKKTRFLTFSGALAVTAALVLTACGGGGEGSSTSTSTTGSGTPATPAPPDAVSQSSAALVAQTGATAVPGTTASAQAFDLTADIGDTWRLVLNQNGTFTIKVLSTQYNLADTSGTFTQSTSGNIVTFIGANGAFTLKLDTRTRTISGSVTLGSRTSGVAGSGYTVPSDTTKLAGDYFYIGATRNASNGGSPSFVGGTFRIAANGTDMTLCDSGLINASGTCDAVAGSNSPGQFALKLVKNSTDGLTHVQLAGSDFGLLSFQAGDRGPVLVIDRFGYNQATPPVLRTGAVYAAKQQVLAGTEANGTWECMDHGTLVGTATFNGTTVQTADTSGQPTAETLYYNNINTNTGLVPVNGAAASVVNGEAASAGVIVLPLSSSLLVVERDAAQSVAVCHPKG